MSSSTQMRQPVNEFNSRPRFGEYAVAVYALIGLALSGLLVWMGSGPGPYERYYANSGIRLICATAAAADIVIITTVIIGALRRTWTRTAATVVILAAITCAVVTWTELWYGSTFYYGEVRDKQGLPYTVNNLGPRGSVLFLWYVVWRIPIRLRPRWIPLSLRAAVTVLLPSLHWIAIRILEGPWGLGQS